MRKALSLLLTLTLLFTLTAPVLASSDGDPVPSWSATTIDGKTINQNTYSSKTQLLVFYRATLTDSGSGMCFNSNSLIEDLAQSDWISTSGLQIIAFDVDGNSAEAVSAYKQKYAPNTNKIVFALNGNSIMWSIVSGDTLAFCAIVQDGKIVDRWTSAHSADFCAQRLLKVMDLDGYDYTYVDAKVTGTFCYDYARQQLDMVNAFRTGSEAWYWNSDNSSKTSYAKGELGALRLDAKLEQIAMERARELAVYYDHVRPNGDSCFNLSVDGVYSYGENIAYGYSTPSGVFTAWREDDYSYSGQGHRRNMLNSGFTAVGFGCFYHQGRYYWVQEFSYSYSGAAPAAASDKQVTGYVQVFTGFLGEDYWSDEGNCPTSQYTPTFPAITTQPASKTVAAGASAAFRVVASGGGLSYQWQYSTDGGKTWKDKAGAASSSYKVTAKASYNGILYRCKVSNSVGSVTSGTAKLTVTGSTAKPVITTQPANKTVAAGASAAFKVAASGTGLTYQWQYSTDGGSTWKNKTGATSASYTVTAKASYDGILYRCKVTNSAGSVTSATAKLTVTSSTSKPVITTQPANKTVAAGASAAFRVAASGTGLTYQWQYSTNGGSTWKNKTGATSASYTVTAKASYNGILYRCKVTNSAGTVTSGTAKLTVTSSTSKPVITTQPANKTVAVGASATFKVVASGTGLTYQWQYSTDGGSTWKNKTGATSASYTVTAKATYDGILYRCKVTNSAGAVYSNRVKLTVTGSAGAPTITSLTAAKAITSGIERITWTAAASGGAGTLQYRFDVYKDGTLVQKGSYGTGKTFIYPATAAGTYKVKLYVKDASGALTSKTSAAVAIP